MTALEFYRKHLHALVSTGKTEYKTEPEIFEQAKAMEREQIMKAYGQGIADEAGEILDATKDAQQYYNETYTND